VLVLQFARGAICFLTWHPLGMMGDKMDYLRIDLGTSGTYFFIISLNKCVAVDSF